MPIGNMPLQTRSAANVPVSVDEKTRTIEVVFTTGAGVRRYDWSRDRHYTEELEVSDAAVRLDRLNNGAPVLDSHERYSTESVIGVVEKGWIDGAEGKATIRIHEGTKEADDLWGKIVGGIIRNVSVGYQFHKIIEEREDDNLIYRVIDWEPTEISFVAVGADSGAGVRSNDTAVFPCQFERLEDSDMADKAKDKAKKEAERKAAETAAEVRTETPVTDEVVIETEVRTEPETVVQPPAKTDDTRAILDLCSTAGIGIRTATGFLDNKRSLGEVQAYIEGKRDGAIDDEDEIDGKRDVDDSQSEKIDFKDAYRNWSGQPNQGA
ncbi:MAG: HK97 family phage prohead protease [Halopseudomonas aestusnigri]